MKPLAIALSGAGKGGSEEVLYNVRLFRINKMNPFYTTNIS
jgi:hypothetical protein